MFWYRDEKRWVNQKHEACHREDVISYQKLLVELYEVFWYRDEKRWVNQKHEACYREDVISYQ